MSNAHRAGFVAVVGRPNVGKSTLINAIVGRKISIVTSKPQTTRHRILAVHTTRDCQVIFVDTPGLQKPKTALGERLNYLIYGSLAEADVAQFVLDARQEVGPGDRLIAQRLVEAGAPTIVVVNKVDVATQDQVIGQLAEAGEWDFAAYVPVSALHAEGLGPIVDELVPRLPEGPFFFPPDMATDQPEQLFAAELIREKYLERLREELPHSLAVIVEGIETRDSGAVYVPATLYVERESQKGMVIGRKGNLIAEVGKEARADLEALFGAAVYLDLRVKVEKDWQRREGTLDRLGF